MLDFGVFSWTGPTKRQTTPNQIPIQVGVQAIYLHSVGHKSYIKRKKASWTTTTTRRKSSTSSSSQPRNHPHDLPKNNALRFVISSRVFLNNRNHAYVTDFLLSLYPHCLAAHLSWRPPPTSNRSCCRRLLIPCRRCPYTMLATHHDAVGDMVFAYTLSTVHVLCRLLLLHW